MLDVRDVLRAAAGGPTLDELDRSPLADQGAWLMALDACIDGGLLCVRWHRGEALERSRYRLTTRGRRLLRAGSIAAAGA